MALVQDTRSIEIFTGIAFREKFVFLDSGGGLYRFDNGIFTAVVGNTFLTQNNGGVEVNFRDSEVILEIPESTTSGMSAGATTYSIRFIPASGAAVTVASGTATVLARMKVILGGAATAYDDMLAPVTGLTRGAVRQPGLVKVGDNGAGSTGVYAYGFDDTDEEEVFFHVQMPHAWKEGTTIRPHMHWFTLANGGVGDIVEWGLEYTIANIGDVFPDTVIISTLGGGGSRPVDDTIVAKTHYLSAFASNIDMANATISCMLICRLFRSVSEDDFTGDAIGIEFDFHYEVDSYGSTALYTK